MIIFKKLGNNKLGVSSVIGIILMVAITVAIAATTYIYFSGVTDEGSQTTPGVIMRAESSQDGNYAEITVISTTNHEINWDDVSGILIDNSDNSQIDLDDLSWKLIGKITAGTIIKIRNGLDITDSDQYLERNSRYTFSLIYQPTNSIMGTCNWVH